MPAPTKLAATQTAPSRHVGKPTVTLPPKVVVPSANNNNAGPSQLKEPVLVRSTEKVPSNDLDFLWVPGLLLQLFPDDIFPVNFDDLFEAIMLPESSLWDHTLNVWQFCPFNKPFASDSSHTPDFKAKHQAAFLNRILRRVFDACYANKIDTSKARRWTAKWSKENPPSRSREDLPPQLSLVAIRHPTHTTPTPSGATWKGIFATAVAKPYGVEHKENLEQLKFNAHQLYCAQDDRRHAISISFAGRDVCVFIADRAGVVGSLVFNLNRNPKAFLRLIAGLSLVDAGFIGMDSSIKTFVRKRSVCVAGIKYTILETLFQSRDFHGPGTVCWRARDDEGNEVVIKNIWANVSSPVSEADIMKLADVEGVVKVIASEVVRINGREDTTAYHRKGVDHYHPRVDWLSDGTIENLAYHRIVMTPYAQPLAGFSSKEELLNVLIDAVEAHGRLVEKHIMHGDIGINNVRIYQPPTKKNTSKETPAPENASETSGPASEAPIHASEAPSEEVKPRRKGILIDLDQAMLFDEEWKLTPNPSEGEVMGTHPFIATELLCDPRAKHRPWHDLESFFFLLIWLGWMYDGPNESEADTVFQDPDVLQQWGDDDILSYDQIGANKLSHVRFHPNPKDDKFEEVVLARFTPYFEDLKPCAMELRRLIYGRGDRKVTHEEVVGVLRKALDYLNGVVVEVTQTETRAADSPKPEESSTRRRESGVEVQPRAEGSPRPEKRKFEEDEDDAESSARAQESASIEVERPQVKKRKVAKSAEATDLENNKDGGVRTRAMGRTQATTATVS